MSTFNLFFSRIKKNWYLLLILLLAAFFRFYKLDWGQGFFFHPDEYHVAASAIRISFPNNMHPNFFNYGTFTTYLIYFIKSLFPFFYERKDAFSQAILIGRFSSAFFSTISVFLTYLIAKLLFNKKTALLAALLMVLTPGLIQQAHFTTPESTLIFWILTSLYFLLWFLYSKKEYKFYLSAFFLAIAIAVKVAALWFLPIFIFALILASDIWQKNKLKKTLLLLKKISLSFLIIPLTFFIFYPYAVLDNKSFLSSIRYEFGLANGNPLVFYTRQFIDTLPFVFQLKNIYLPALGLPVLLISIFGLLLFVINLKKIKKLRKVRIIFLLAFLAFYLPNSFLFAKWTRFSAPIFPFLAIFSAYFLKETVKNIKGIDRVITKVTLTLFFLLSIIWTLMFFSIYLRDDIRISATKWFNQNIPAGSRFLVEGGNMLDIPLFGGKHQRTSLDFYAYEKNPEIQGKVLNAISNSDYVVIQSRRVFFNHLRLASEYPQTARFYELLFNGKLGFKKIAEFNSYPQLNFLGKNITISDEQMEETWSVFDHPVIRVYQKAKPYSYFQYQGLLSY